MTHLCYTLEEAAEKLNLSETVLVRLSQSFKVPNHAYEEVGYLSFKGDLTFSDQDIAFFRQVKERLLAGETLEEVKSRIRHNEPVDPVVHAQPTPSVQVHQPEPISEPAYQEPVPSELPIGLSRLREPVASEPIRQRPETVEIPQPVYQQPPQTEPVYSQPQPSYEPEPRPKAQQTYETSYAPPVSEAPMMEIEDRTPFEKAAERSFNRYKNMHHPGLGKVFEKMIKEVGTHTQEATKRDKFPVLKPLKSHVQETDELFLEDIHPEAQLPFTKNQPRSVADNTPPWESVLKSASRQPRALNTNLKTAAMLLREKALSPESTQHSSRR